MNTRVVVLIILLSAVYAIEPLEVQFVNFMKKFNREYATQEEYNKRFEIYKDNLLIAEELQKNSPSARFGVTKFSDLSREEFRSKYLVLNLQVKQNKARKYNPNVRNNIVPNPVNWDW